MRQARAARLRSCLTVWLSMVGASLVVACAGSSSSPTAASRLPDLDRPSLPSGPDITVSLVGRVTETDPTPIVEVPSAMVRIMDGPDAGRTDEANGFGFFSIERVHPGKFTVTASAEGFVTASQVVEFGVQ